YATQTIVDGGSVGYNIRSFSSGGTTNVYAIALNGSVSQVYAYYPPGVVVQWTYSPSDRRLKSNIASATGDALAAINKLTVRSFDLTVPIPGAIEQHWDYGLVADEVGEALPVAYAPATDEGTYDLIRELPLIAALVKAMQQLTDKIDDLDAR